MFIIDNKNSISKVPEIKFSESRFSERKNLQEWIAKNPSCLGEELIIIQKEFSGFSETKERLDLLAIDKEGNLVIIENKLDDSGKDVVWQALKYASYCSSLTKQQILKMFRNYLESQGSEDNPETILGNFFENQDFEQIKLNEEQSQRIFLIAASFRKEVTSTVLWLLNYNIRIKCFTLSLFKANNHFLNIEQIIPIKDSEEYIIKMAEKKKETIKTKVKSIERNKMNEEFWEKLLDKINLRTKIYQNISTTNDMFLYKSAGVGGVKYTLGVSRTYARVEFYIGTSNKQKNEEMFQFLINIKDEIESELGFPLVWEDMSEKIGARIKYENQRFSINSEQHWDDMVSFLIETVIKFEKTFSKQMPKLKQIYQTSRRNENN